MNAAKVPLLLDPLMLGQILDALETRREAWEQTSAYFRGELDDPFFSIEECSDSDEADEIAAFYRQIEDELREQWDRHRASSGE